MTPKIFMLGAADPTTACSFSIPVVVPNTPPGTYTITPIEVGAGGIAQDGQVRFVVGS